MELEDDDVIPGMGRSCKLNSCQGVVQGGNPYSFSIQAILELNDTGNGYSVCLYQNMNEYLLLNL